MSPRRAQNAAHVASQHLIRWSRSVEALVGQPNAGRYQKARAAHGYSGEQYRRAAGGRDGARTNEKGLPPCAHLAQRVSEAPPVQPFAPVVLMPELREAPYPAQEYARQVARP